ncbi:MAG: hypothetical protein K0R72_856 [Clostridia bacterium]|jgi:hypothetical protein|nr:hypothetical protein [Clostridia bacterium]
MRIQENYNGIVNRIESICPTNNNKTKPNLPETKKRKESFKANNFKSMLDVEMKKLV